jgi:lipase
VRLHVHEWGEGDAPPVVCLHGVTAHGGRFRRLAERLPGFRVLAFDLRGHGLSGWEPPWGIEAHIEDVLETVEAAGIARATWIGHSFGGRLIVELAAREPDRVARAVLLDPAIRLRPDIALRLAEAQRIERRFGSRSEAFPPETGSRLLRTPPERIDEEREEHLEQQGDGTFRWRYCHSAAVAILGELANWGPPPEQILAPTLLVLGADDSVVGRGQLDRYRRALGDRLEVVTVPGGHEILWEAFAETADAVAEFLAAA